MRTTLFAFWIILMSYDILGQTNNKFKNEIHRIQRNSVDENRNTGCDMLYTDDVNFRYKTIVFYSQRLIFNSLDDVKRLSNKLKLFITNCCLAQPNTECYFSSTIIAQNRICEDYISLSKNKQSAFCCDQDFLERERCFKNLQNNPPLQLPSMGDLVSYEEECLAWTADRQLFIDSYLHGFARRLTKFSPTLTIDIFISFLIIYMKCCNKSEEIHLCFSTETNQFSESMRTKIQLGNTMCQNNQQWKRLRALIFHAKLKPVDSMEKAMDFGSKLMDLVFKCCNPETMSSECFDTWSGVLLTRICSLMDSSLQKDCCLKNDPERENCLIHLAYRESKELPPVSLEPKEMCQLSRESKLLTWMTYEYSRRNQNDTITSHLTFANNIKKLVTSCCTTNDTSLCLSEFNKQFPV